MMNESHARALLDSAATGNTESLSRLYEIFADETYSICARYIPERILRDDAMVQLWLHYWQSAPRLAAVVGSVRETFVSVAHAHAHAYANGHVQEPLLAS